LGFNKFWRVVALGRLAWFCKFPFVHGVACDHKPFCVQGYHSFFPNQGIALADEPLRKFIALGIERDQARLDVGQPVYTISRIGDLIDVAWQ
jgi:hypothetical protein